MPELTQWQAIARDLTVTAILMFIAWGLYKFIDAVRKGEWYPKHFVESLKSSLAEKQALLDKAMELNSRYAVAVELLAKEVRDYLAASHRRES